MSVALKIKDVADASGFTTATVRYYEQLGLLPEASRTAAGYRMYDQRTIERLGFIARAKQLGCTLEEIAGLTTAWEGGQCGPLQDQLRQLVATKTAEAEQRITELITMTHELEAAAAALERHRPVGACDDACGCISDRQVGDVVLLTAKPVPTNPPIACTLSPTSMGDRLTEWRSLLSHVGQRQRLADGWRCEFGSEVPTAELIRLVTAEQECCRFFEFAITVDARGLGLEVRAPGEAQAVVESLFGAPQ